MFDVNAGYVEIVLFLSGMDVVSILNRKAKPIITQAVCSVH